MLELRPYNLATVLATWTVSSLYGTRTSIRMHAELFAYTACRYALLIVPSCVYVHTKHVGTP